MLAGPQREVAPATPERVSAAQPDSGPVATSDSAFRRSAWCNRLISVSFWKETHTMSFDTFAPSYKIADKVRRMSRNSAFLTRRRCAVRIIIKTTVMFHLGKTQKCGCISGTEFPHTGPYLCLDHVSPVLKLGSDNQLLCAKCKEIYTFFCRGAPLKSDMHANSYFFRGDSPVDISAMARPIIKFIGAK